MRHIPRKRFGQHFLLDQSVLRDIVDAVDPRAGQNLIEIGPGEGALTRLLLERAGSLKAVEIDRDLAAALLARYAARGLELHTVDVLDFDLGQLGAQPRLVGNLPYNISTPLLFRIAALHDMVDAHFMLQEEVVDRMVARPSTADYGRLTVTIQARFAVEKLFSVPPAAFRPPPKVQSAVVRLTPLATGVAAVVNTPVFADLVRAAFSQRRKMLRNALGEWFDSAQLAELHVDPSLRPEDLSVEQYVALAQVAHARSAADTVPRPAGLRRADAE